MGVEPGTAFFVQGPIGVEHEFRKDKLHQLQQPDVLQEVYGVPEWLAALQAGLLNENATLFRRRYYLNGAHAGFVFYLSEALADQETKDNLKDQLKNAKRSEEHTSELQSLMRISYAVFCLKKKNKKNRIENQL